ncbi:MAG: hypothetical protein WAM39_12445 [Bryobacteraceae bacterium]
MKLFSKNLLILAAILAAPLTIQLEYIARARVPEPQNTSAAPDPRTVRLHRFFAKLHCPIKDLAEEFVHAADDNDLDWRLLPSISIIESSGGKAYKNNNVFGWANGDHVFPTVAAGLHQVAFALGKSFIYRNRTTDQKLRLYNPADDYPARVEEVMYQISPVVELKAADLRVRFPRAELGFLARN